MKNEQSESMEINPQRWVEWLKVKGLSDRSIENYYFYYQKFDFEKLGQEYVISFLHKYNNPVARAFMKGIIEYLKLKNIEIPKITGRKRVREPEIISLDEVLLVSNAMRTTRNKIMALLNFYAGLRVSELVNIKPLDFRWKKWSDEQDNVGYLKIIGKGNKQRAVFIPPSLMRTISNWINSMGINEENKENPLFKIKKRRYQALLSNASYKSLNKKIYPHILRHSCATYLLEHGLNIVEVAEFLGHKSIVTTQKYLHLVDRKKLAEKVKKAYE